MSYKLYTDKQEVFECKISLEGASLKNANARIIIESNDINLMFPGTIDKDGNCEVSIKKLKGLLDENDKGNIKLEVIAEDTYFEPWQSEFIIETAKKIKVEVKGQSEVKKPKAVVTEVKKQVIIKKDPIQEIANSLYQSGVRVNNIPKVKTKIIPILKEYSDSIGYKKGFKKFIKEVVRKLANK
tara:strand:- start:155 stop:706 length:552 start_codon:yes stop_codon:yes gene_type:complete